MEEKLKGMIIIAVVVLVLVAFISVVYMSMSVNIRNIQVDNDEQKHRYNPIIQDMCVDLFLNRKEYSERYNVSIASMHCGGNSIEVNLLV